MVPLIGGIVTGTAGRRGREPDESQPLSRHGAESALFRLYSESAVALPYTITMSTAGLAAIWYLG